MSILPSKFVVAMRIPSNFSICSKKIFCIWLCILSAEDPAPSEREDKNWSASLRSKIGSTFAFLLSSLKSSNILRTFFSLSPTYIDKILEQSNDKIGRFKVLAKEIAVIVFPVPAAP